MTYHTDGGLGQTTSFAYDNRGLETLRTISRGGSQVQSTSRTYFDNGLTETIAHQAASGQDTGSFTIGYEQNGLFVNGHRTTVAWWQTSPDTATACTN